MNPGLILIAGLALAGGALSFWLRRRVAAATLSIGIFDIPRLLATLSQSRSVPAFAVLMFDASGDASSTLNLQFAMEAGKLGFEWVLLAPQNLKDQHLFQDFARENGYAAEAKEMNSVRYLRVENGDLSSLCTRIITEMYLRPKDKPIDLLVEGFDWPPAEESSNNMH